MSELDLQIPSTYVPFAESNAEDSAAESKDYVHIRIQQRNGRKSLTYEHTSLLASLLLYIRARKSPYAHAPLHTSISVSVRACCSTYEHISRHARIRASQSHCESAALHSST
ncbi:putative SUI1 domain superfamily protein [Helianthus annuus]|nr:putative SUI1 domain superfamily protein [Helianthus annuus]KAJ0517046.1 putative SUI1 domain superfamily protein [Helianthus annuus]KAJ0685055.1 putative SUI1 domain superfamily protein [Helianthus annuus]KAJ0874688.1 putative SUI1 domain superfamily protein [Helianthus annuus]